MKIVTRHPALVRYLHELGVPASTPIIEHATVEDVRGETIIGVLPLSLAVHAHLVVEIPLALELADRGQELSLERVREIAGPPIGYTVRTRPLDPIADWGMAD